MRSNLNSLNLGRATLKHKRLPTTRAFSAHVELLETRTLLTVSTGTSSIGDAGVALATLPTATPAASTLRDDVVNLAGPFNAGLSVSNASVSIGSIHATLSQWILFGHTNINFSASNQTANLTMSPISLHNEPASGTVDMSFDNTTPGTLHLVNAINVDLNGAGGSNVTIPFTINASPITINASGLDLTVALTLNGHLTDLRFDSTDVSGTPDSPTFISPGNFTAVLDASVDGKLILPLGLGSINLGTLGSIGPLSESVSAGILGFTTFTDQGGLTFPHDMHANIAVDLGNLSIPFPLSTTLDTNQNFPGPPSGKSGLTHIDVQNTVLNATLTLSGLSYNLNGVDPQALEAPNSAPTLDLGNNPNYATTWNYAPVAIENSATATLTDDSGTIASMTVALSSHPGDVLSANLSGTPITQSWDGTNLVLSGITSAADYQQVLRTITYNNTAGAPGVTSETATFTALDADDTPLASAPAVATINITPASTLSNALVFYKGSTRYDTTTPASRNPLPFSDDNAIAIDKSAYIPNGATAGFGNFTSYSAGLNGIMVDLLGGGTHTSITLANILNDFTFKVGGGGTLSNTAPGTWVNAPNPIAVIVRPNVNPISNGAGTVSGSDRVELIWADNAIQQQWLEVIVKPTANTGLAANAVFFYGNEIGNTNAFNTSAVARTGTSDLSAVQTHGAVLSANIPITNTLDFDRDGKVGTSDVSAIQTHGTTATTGLKLLVLGTAGPFAPEALPLASPSLAIPGLPTIPASILNKLGSLASSTGPLAKYLERLAHEGTAEAKTLLSEASSLAHLFAADTSFIDGLLNKVVSALPSAGPAISVPAIPPGLLNRLGNLNLDLNAGPVAKYFEKLAHEATEGAKKILKTADDVADFLHMDHSLLDSLLDRLGIDD
jgi:hypothetical protein